jgi:hypothetical protein
MFEEEKPFLQSLPPMRFEYYRISERTVHFDGYIEIDGAYYHAPPQRAGTRITVHIGPLWICCWRARPASAARRSRPTARYHCSLSTIWDAQAARKRR